jgi:hypothetical protein
MFTIESLTDARWDNAGHSTFTATVKFAEHDAPVPFTFSEAEWPELWGALTADNIAEYVAPTVANAAFTYKTDIWRRMTETECETFEAAINQAPAKLRGLWNDCLSLEHSAPEFASFKAQMGAAFGADRAETIMAPSQPSAGN